MEKPDNSILVIFGASGDLTYRKLVPAIYALKVQGLLPENFAVMGVSRTALSDGDFRNKMKEAIRNFTEEKDLLNEQKIEEFTSRLSYLSIDLKSPSDYSLLKEKLDEIDKQQLTGGNYLYYMALPPSMFEIITGNLAFAGLNKQSGGYKRVVVEKPFGYDLETGIQLNARIHENFEENQIYRIDHYLGKESVQNLLVTRFANGIFEPLWNRNYVHHVEVTSSESIGVENRGRYYDSSGALRDMVQNHLLQIVGLTAMEPPSSLDSDSIRNETLKVMQSLRPIAESEVGKSVIRGQYLPSVIRGEHIPGYRDEKDVAKDSRTETYVAMKFYIDNWRWGGVPFYIRTGKRLPTKVTEIVIHFKATPHYLFAKSEVCSSGNQLIIRIQPDEGLLIKFGMKLPGSGFNVKEVNMDFHYSDLSDIRLPSAYERLIYDALVGDSTLFARSDAVEAAWKFVTPILNAWANNPSIKIFGYPAGSWGPECADNFIEGKNITWRYPCKNLTNDSNYCEL